MAENRKTLRLCLREPDGNDELIYEDVELDLLTPKARALAETIGQSALKARRHFLIESDAGELRAWDHWRDRPANASESAILYLEYEARKIPQGWHVYGISVERPAPSREAAANDRHLTERQARAYLRLKLDDFNRLRAKLPRGDRYVGRAPEWLPETLDAFAAETLHRDSTPSIEPEDKP